MHVMTLALTLWEPGAFGDVEKSLANIDLVKWSGSNKGGFALKVLPLDIRVVLW